jgi:Flp pilus assembly protein TadG
MVEGKDKAIMEKRRGATAFAFRLIRCLRGTSGIEMTLVLPLLFLLLGGVIEFGRALYHHHILETSMRNATRYLARVPATGQNPSDACASTAGSAANTARNLTLYGSVDGSGTALVPYLTSADMDKICISGPTMVTVTVSGGTIEVPVIGMSIRATYENLGFLGLIGLDSIEIAARHEERLIGE